jgi:hypothetical protein
VHVCELTVCERVCEQVSARDRGGESKRETEIILLCVYLCVCVCVGGLVWERYIGGDGGIVRIKAAMGVLRERRRVWCISSRPC